MALSTRGFAIRLGGGLRRSAGPGGYAPSDSRADATGATDGAFLAASPEASEGGQSPRSNAAIASAARGTSLWRDGVRRLLRNRLAMAGGVVIVLLVLIAVFYIFYYSRLADLASPVHAELAKICIIIFLASYLRETGDILVRPRLRPLPLERQLLLYGLPALLTLLAILVLGLGTAGSVLLVVFVASLVAVLRERPSPKHFGPLLLVWGLAMLMLIVIRDLGSSLMFFGGFLALLYAATGRLSLVAAGATMFFGGAVFFANNVSHVHERVEIWLDPFKRGVVDNEGYQIAQSLFAQADGGLFGQGFGQALLELPGGGTILPAPHTDLIYAVLTNEVGLFGAAGLIGAYLLFVWRGYKTAMLASDGFSKLLAVGLTAVFALQVFVIVGGVTRVIPLTGVTLPFVSYGGSSIVANMVLLALLLIVSDHARSERIRRGGLV